eukprot:5709843-Prorocentrum_lima.AAC.1
MTSSLVGSEMCIRDSHEVAEQMRIGRTRRRHVDEEAVERLGALRPVSYTHLTLPTSVDLGGR